MNHNLMKDLIKFGHFLNIVQQCKIRRTGKYSAEEDIIIKNMYFDGKSLDEIAEKLHRSTDAIYSRIHFKRYPCERKI